MVDDTKQVRVDNWAIFFLQRLQMLFSKTDYCDMTLQFHGNVQLKVHRLVLNACTEYFQHMHEETNSAGELVIEMPPNLQADVIVPIINFMYTGLLEFPLGLYERLYETANEMKITILIKLLEAQKQPTGYHRPIKRKATSDTRKTLSKELPAQLPGKKVPVWKRKTVPQLQSHSSVSPLYHQSESRWNTPPDPLCVGDNTPKPTRFEWPDEELPSIDIIDTSYDDVSYTSKPLLTKEEALRTVSKVKIFDDLKQMPDSSCSTDNSTTHSPVLDLQEIQTYAQEQKIRSVFQDEDDQDIDNDLKSVPYVEVGQRRGNVRPRTASTPAKKIKLEGAVHQTISVSGGAVKNPDLDHEKIVSEILKKYPQLVKKNKNIKLKIMTKNSGNKEIGAALKRTVKQTEEPKKEAKTTWKCSHCGTADEPLEFALYYLYRKHMTDMHNEVIDTKLCRYCGHRCNREATLHYHMYTKHGMKPALQYQFPKCDRCPYIAMSNSGLVRHQRHHVKGEAQCKECSLAFTSPVTLTSHVQITGHLGKNNRRNYDCQYCTKRYPNAIYLFSHVRAQHKNEARRDGMVSIDEPDEIDGVDVDDEDNDDVTGDAGNAREDEYILPEILDEQQQQQQQHGQQQAKKVNILSNVKVQDRVEQQQQQQQQVHDRRLSLEPSSEAEALNNVATGIATSLGLVDIVVLNDNQQLFLDPDDGQEYRERQPEFILPELSGHQEIGSTDELVMVLTDHDYGDNQEETTNDSNIVVLYSHPVDGQQEQFITSQSNIMVNSQTGLLELRNGTTVSNENADDADAPIESIEMIQREIESHNSSNVVAEVKPEPSAIIPIVEDEEMKKANEALVHSLEQGEQIEFAAEPIANDEQSDEVETEGETVEIVPSAEEPCSEVVTADGSVSEAPESESTSEAAPQIEVEEPTRGETEEVELPAEIMEQETVVTHVQEQEDSQPDDEPAEAQTEPMEVIEQTETATTSDVSSEEMQIITQKEVAETEEPAVVTTEEQNQESTDMEVGDNEIGTVEQEEEEEERTSGTCENENESENHASGSEETRPEAAEVNEEEQVEAASKPVEDSRPKIDILEDWDEDSQNSDKSKRIREESVNKLMDDWEGEEEEERRAHAENK